MKFKKKLEQIFESDFEDDWGGGMHPDIVATFFEQFEIDESKANRFLAYLEAKSIRESFDTKDMIDLFLNGIEATKNYDFEKVLEEIGKFSMEEFKQGWEDYFFGS